MHTDKSTQRYTNTPTQNKPTEREREREREIGVGVDCLWIGGCASGEDHSLWVNGIWSRCLWIGAGGEDRCLWVYRNGF